MADSFRIDAAWLDALDRYVEGLVTDTSEVAANASQYLQDAVIDRARQRPDWVNMADNIETWSEDGRLVIGVRDREMVSAAFAMEYGTETAAPSPFFRTMGAITERTKRYMERELMARRGSSVIKGMKV